MKKYVGMRILRSLVSILLVTTLTYGIIYALVPRHLIFRQDPNYNKMVTTADKRINYENQIYSKTGYIEYKDSKDLSKIASTIDSKVTVDNTKKNKKFIKIVSINLEKDGNFTSFQKVKNFMQYAKFHSTKEC
ncbi:Oligopeptide transport system permease protein OppB [Streptococcus sp. HSISB1]|nr:Oligopeptide transport system permease protein OppB [Streptococcus sp. HSISB1]